VTVRTALSARARVALALLAATLVVASVALAACGKGAATTTITTARGAGAPAPERGSHAPSVQRARAFARAVNLTADDVPGFKPNERHSQHTGAERRLEREMLSCAGLGGAKQAVLEEGSKSFQLKQGVIDLSVSSEVTVEPTAQTALRALAAIRSAHVRGCFSRYLERAFRAEHVSGATVGPVTIQAGTPPAPGTSGGFGWRVTASFGVRGIRVPLYLDILGFIDGPSEVTLLSSSVLRPFPAEAQQHLFALLLARARAHSL
jgi:hypothetical protein